LTPSAANPRFIQHVLHGSLDQGLDREGRDLLQVLRRAVAVLVQLCGIKIDIERDVGLAEGRQSVRQDRRHQPDKRE
jgi:uncharacterized protein YprB with RNaseH-like and TPR domain